MPKPWRTFDGHSWQPNPVCSAAQWYKKTGRPLINTSGAWGTANLAVYVPIYIEDLRNWQYGNSMTAEMCGYSGSTRAGTVQLGIYAPDSEGKPGTQLGTAAASAVAANGWFYRQVNLTNIDVTPRGLVYLALVCTDSTQTVYRMAQAGTTGFAQVAGGIFTQAAAAPLPATATPSASFVDCAVPLLNLRWRY